MKFFTILLGVFIFGWGIGWFIGCITSHTDSFSETALRNTDRGQDDYRVISDPSTLNSSASEFDFVAGLETRDRILFPNGPTFLGFPLAPPSGILAAAQYGMGETWWLAFWAARAAYCMTPEFLRYFLPTDQARVIKVFEAIMGPSGTGFTQMADPSSPLHVIYGDKPVAGEPDRCAASPNMYGFFQNERWDNFPGAVMILCPYLFEWYVTSLKDFECKDLPPFADETLGTVSGGILHEFTHWHSITDAVGEYQIIDYGFDHGTPIAVDGLPLNGYGPWPCQELRRQFKGPSLNADNYHWFAVEAFFAAQCNHIFEDAPPPAADGPAVRPGSPAPPQGQDFENGNATS